MFIRTLLSSLFLALAVAVAAPPVQAAANDPAQFVTELGNKALDVLNQKQLPQGEREKRFRALLNEGFDVPAIGRFVLGRYYRTATDQQRQEFTKLFEDYIVQAYTARFSQYSGETFKVTGSRPESETASLVTSQIIRTNGAPPVKVDWRVIKTNNGFKIDDVIVEGVSMKITQRDEFASVIQRNGGQVDALLNMLREKTKA
jgi:phospholipid transport system substrate-binding protein